MREREKKYRPFCTQKSQIVRLTNAILRLNDNLNKHERLIRQVFFSKSNYQKEKESERKKKAFKRKKNEREKETWSQLTKIIRIDNLNYLVLKFCSFLSTWIHNKGWRGSLVKCLPQKAHDKKVSFLGHKRS